MKLGVCKIIKITSFKIKVFLTFYHVKTKHTKKCQNLVN